MSATTLYIRLSSQVRLEKLVLKTLFKLKSLLDFKLLDNMKVYHNYKPLRIKSSVDIKIEVESGTDLILLNGYLLGALIPKRVLNFNKDFSDFIFEGTKGSFIFSDCAEGFEADIFSCSPLMASKGWKDITKDSVPLVPINLSLSYDDVRLSCTHPHVRLRRGNESLLNDAF